MLALVPIARAPQSLPTWEQVDALVKDQKLAGGRKAGRSHPPRGTEAQRRGGVDEGADPRSPAADGAPRLRDRGPLPEGRALAARGSSPGRRSSSSTPTRSCNYAQTYSWEIGKRERVESPDRSTSRPGRASRSSREARAGVRLASGRSARRSARCPSGASPSTSSRTTIPTDVRGTLRDAVSLPLRRPARRTRPAGRPAQSNDVCLLDARRRCSRRRGAVARHGSSIRPCTRSRGSSRSSATWRAGTPPAGRPRPPSRRAWSALRRLHAAFTEEPDARARSARTSRRGFPPSVTSIGGRWGRPQLALFRQTEDAPDNLIRARERGARGVAGLPEVRRRRNCCNSLIVQRSRRRTTQLAAMSSDGPDRRSIELTHKNLASLSFRAYAIDLESADRGGAELQPAAPAAKRSASCCSRPDRSREWSTSLPPTPDYRPHRTLRHAADPLGRPVPGRLVGQRTTSALKNNRIDSAANSRRRPRARDAGREPSERIEARVLSGETGQPVPGAEVMLYALRLEQGHGHHRIESKLTDADGTALASTTPRDAPKGNLFLVARDRTRLRPRPERDVDCSSRRGPPGSLRRARSTPTEASTGRSRRSSGRSSRTAGVRDLGALSVAARDRR